MHRTLKSQKSKVLSSSQAQREEKGLGRGQVSKGEDATTTATMKEVSGRGTPSCTQSSLGASPLPTVMSFIAGGPSDGASGNQAEGREAPVPHMHHALKPKIVDLVQFLLLKYRMKELTTKAEMEDRIIGDYKEHYPVIFREASECMKLVFGIDMVEVDPAIHSYLLVPALGITYDGMLHGVQGIPKTGLLITTLYIIFMEGNCVSEDIFWDVLNRLGIYARRNHYLFGEPRKLITKDFVQEGYLQYRQVPDSDPPCHEFLWGPKTHAQTTKMKVLEFFSRVTRRDPKSYTEMYAEALRDEKERA